MFFFPFIWMPVFIFNIHMPIWSDWSQNIPVDDGNTIEA